MKARVKRLPPKSIVGPAPTCFAKTLPNYVTQAVTKPLPCLFYRHVSHPLVYGCDHQSAGHFHVLFENSPLCSTRVPLLSLYTPLSRLLEVSISTTSQTISKPKPKSSSQESLKLSSRDKRAMKGGDIDLPPGFRFHPTDEELVMSYLCRKCASLSISVPIIAEIDLYKFDPWQLPGMASYGEKEWYFFSPRDRKYPNGSRPNRAAASGYWKATGADKPIGTPSPIGIKKALVFYTGKAPRGVKTNWIMHEYRLANVDRSARKKNNSRLDEWVLCRIYNKKGVLDEELNTDKKPMIRSSNYTDGPKSKIAQINDMKMLPPPPPPPPPMGSAPPSQQQQQQHDMHYFETSESVPKLHTDSSCSEHVISPEFACEREVQSEPRWKDWENGLDNMQMQFNSMDAISPNGNPYESPFVQNNQLSPLQDMFMFLNKPF